MFKHMPCHYSLYCQDKSCYGDMVIVELAQVVSLVNVDRLLQLDLGASTMSQKTDLKNWCFLDPLTTHDVDGLPLCHVEFM